MKYFKRRGLCFLGAIAMSLSLSACFDNSSRGITPTTDPATEDEPTPVDTATAECADIVETTNASSSGAQVVFCESFDQDNGTVLSSDTSYWGIFPD